MNLSNTDLVTLEEMLIAREKRVMIQSTLIQSYRVPLICFTLNIPGPVKVFDNLPEIFSDGCEQIEHILERNKISFFHAQSVEEKTGREAFYCADGSPEDLKKWMTALEDGSTIGRLYDIDVLRIDGTKVSREEFGMAPRKCLLCDEYAHACSRNRTHSVEELITHIRKIITF